MADPTITSSNSDTNSSRIRSKNSASPRSLHGCGCGCGPQLATVPTSSSSSSSASSPSSGGGDSAGSGAVADLTPLSDSAVLSTRVATVLGLNPGMMTLQGTNTYLVGTGSSRLLIDTGEGGRPKYVKNLLSVLDSIGANTISDILITHYHYDHTGGIKEVLAAFPEQNIKVWKYTSPGLDGDNKEHDYQHIADGQQFVTEGATLTAVHTPGHTEDHMVFYLKEEQIVFSGDCVLGSGTAVFSDLYTYMKSLARIQQLQPKQIYPAHGPVIADPTQKVDFYIAHRLQREKQIVQTLESMVPTPQSSMDLVRIIYADVPEHLHLAANNNVVLHLHKLEKDGVVRLESADGGDPRWQLVSVRPLASL